MFVVFFFSKTRPIAIYICAWGLRPIKIDYKREKISIIFVIDVAAISKVRFNVSGGKHKVFFPMMIGWGGLIVVTDRVYF